MSQWKGDVREDGLYIGLTDHGFTIVPRHGTLPDISYCPCCGGQITSVTAAKALADILFPIRNGSTTP